MTEKELQLSIELIKEKIHIIRGQKVMLDRDLAGLYGVKTGVLNQAVKRKKNRFPKDFMFSLTREEIMNLSQSVISSRIKHAPNVNVFTEQGIAMLSSVLNSGRAVEINIKIMRVFIDIRKTLAVQTDIYKRLNKVEIKALTQDKRIDRVDQVIDEMLKLPVILKRKTKKIGFRKEKK